jgi:hypothetical protein
VYGGCTTQCKYGPFCGDGNVDADGMEKCDKGRANGTNAGYGGDGCKASCQLPARCGDGIVDTAFGEGCDEGADNSDASGAFCSTECKIAVR